MRYISLHEILPLQLRLSSDFDTMSGYDTNADLINDPCQFTTKI